MTFRIRQAVLALRRTHVARSSTQEKLRKTIRAARRQGFANNFGERQDRVNGVAMPICNAGGELFATLDLIGFANQLEW
jgi:DNA-binding IclR family transcriptional regulator